MAVNLGITPVGYRGDGLMGFHGQSRKMGNNRGRQSGAFVSELLPVAVLGLGFRARQSGYRPLRPWTLGFADLPVPI